MDTTLLAGEIEGIVLYGRPRCCTGKTDLKRRVRWRSWLKWLWIEAWAAANFCRVFTSLNLCITRSRRRNG